jgi:hypothetical protein
MERCDVSLFARTLIACGRLVVWFVGRSRDPIATN